MNNKILNGFFIFCVIALVGVMSWRDMHPKVNTSQQGMSLSVMYYVGANIMPDQIPSDSLPLTISVGGFLTTPDGKTTWRYGKWAPTTFAQRQVNLQFHLSGLPQDPAETIARISSVADDWVHKGDTINILILDYSPNENPDLKAYTAFFKAAHKALEKKYVLYAGINVQWLDWLKKGDLDELQDYSPQFLIRMPEAQIFPDLLAKLEAFKYNVDLQFRVGVQFGDLDKEALRKLPSLSSVTLTLDPHTPLPMTEQKVGLFPKL